MMRGPDAVSGDKSVGRRPVMHYPGPGVVVTSDYVDYVGGRVAIADLTRVVRRVDNPRHPRRMTIEAESRGQRIQLFSTRDPREFGQVCRALTRAIEDFRATRY
jgi:Family of unknown function (DUF6232)